MHAEQAIERFGPLVMSLIWRINGNHDETADLYQEVFVKFHETTSQRGPLQQPKAWLCRTAINAALDFNRQRARFVSWSESAEHLTTGRRTMWSKMVLWSKKFAVSRWICPSAAEKSSSSATSKAVPSSRSPSF